MRRTDDREMPACLLITVRTFVSVQSTFMAADEFLHKFDIFRKVT